MLRRVLLLSLIPLFLSSCGGDPAVEQIPVQIPDGLNVPADMVYIPEGEFIMGTPDDERTLAGQKVFLKAYLIDRYEVSHKKFAEKFPDHTFSEKKAAFPVTQVNFFQAEDFCHSLGKRLPTEAEWEKAARGVDGRKWPWLVYYKHPNDGFSGFIPEPVDKREKWISPYGVFGMGHNVWEWTTDWYSYGGMPEKDQNQFKIIRGGLTQSHLTVKFTPTYFRNWMEPEAKLNFIGFRCAKDVE